jgi:hypothetical protein
MLRPLIFTVFHIPIVRSQLGLDVIKEIDNNLSLMEWQYMRIRVIGKSIKVLAEEK